MTKKSKIEGGKWEELPIECLVNVLGRVGIESLIVDVPFVCKLWHKATLDPFCWKELHFPGISAQLWPPHPFVDRFKDRFRIEEEISLSEPKFIKGVIDRSAGFATTIDLRFCCDDEEEVINYVTDKCPALKNLVFWGDDVCFMEDILPLVIGKLKNLETLEMKSEFQFKGIITEIGSHCENFVSLKLVGTEDDCPNIEEEDVMAIVTGLPKLKFLALKDFFIDREMVIKIIKGCVNLVCLDVRDCRGFDEDDEELSKLASHIPTFMCTGSYIDTASESESDSGNSD